jgi:crotonobetainyl-CoA:carnitine CoA-transferase CaiB-like acyl-CoA transferase
MSLDYSTAMISTAAALAALYHRDRSGKGQFIDMSLHDSGVIFSVPWMGFYLSGMKYRHGNRSRVFAPYNMYAGKDGYVMIAIGEDNRWSSFLRAIGRDDLVDDPRFRNVEERVNHYDDIDALISGWAKNLTVKEVMDAVISAGGASAPVKTLAEAMSDKHSISREMLIETDDPRVGKLKVAGSPFKMSETPGRVTSLAPKLGEHSRLVLSETLGYPAASIEELVRLGVTTTPKE